eukprot:TRINITY_DN110522_c0_g1_i1.p1 TRINITY_DN110522_c0_g1~~TRINITY_DN110522_c0_g1_i1.p1  ORF type:complete len:370 (+),score=63.96 TRINITY_DN110522_c0_g1_i1:33-1112(+)
MKPSGNPELPAEPCPMGTLRIVGSPVSPYSRKLLAVLRFRRIPYRWISHGGPDHKGLRAAPGPPLLPNLIFEDGEAMADSTPIIEILERRYESRSIYPAHKGLNFINLLLEDYADEWLTKSMFHFRWWFKADIEHAARIMPRILNHTLKHDQHKTFENMVKERQTSRVTEITGSSEATAPVIEESYKSFLQKLNDHLSCSRFLFGRRPSAADFAMFGQLTQLTHFDPTPRAIAEQVAPRVLGYVSLVDDMSGVEAADDGWEQSVGPTLKALLSEAGRLYAPFMVANATAIAKGHKRVSTTLDGQLFEAKSFPYQFKCLRKLREHYFTLGDAKNYVDNALEGTGLLQMFGDLDSELGSRL